MNPKHLARRQAAFALLAKAGMTRIESGYLVNRLAWRMGIDLPLPMFVPFYINFPVHAGLCALLWAVLMDYLGRDALPGALVFGLAMGALLAVPMEVVRRRLKLPRWRDLA